MRTEDTHDFSPLELWFLFCQHAPVTIIGFSDPTIGLLAHEIEQIVLMTGQSLLQRNVIAPGHDRPWVVREPYWNLTQGIANPVHTILIANRDSSATGTLHSYHITTTQILELHQQQSGNYSITASKNFDVVLSFFTEPLLKNIYMERDEPAVIVSDIILHKAYALIENKQMGRARNLLKNSFQVPEQAERFIDAIVHPIIRVSLVAFLHRNETARSKTTGLSVVATNQDIWLLKPENERLDLVQAKSITKLELEETINSLLPRLELVQ